MKKIEHQLFLENNKLEKKLLFQPIGEKIEIFDRMYLLLKDVSDCEKGNLLEQLETLDLEILEDIEEQYADKLQYNDIEKALEEKPSLEKTLSEKEPIEVQSKKHVEKASEEAILDKFFQMGRTKNIGASTFKDLGIKTSLGWGTVIGKYHIKRTSVFRYRYQILKIK